MWKPIILDVECIVCNKSLQKINHDPGHTSRNMGKAPRVSKSRRLRTPNWSLEEKQYLLELIKSRKELVVTKSNNGPNYSEEKDVAWNEILKELAVKFGSKFVGSSIKKVKTQWQNMKRVAREEIALHGPELEKLSKQSLEVCHILDLVKDGELKIESQNLNLSESLTTNVEIKAERIEEELSQPGCSSINNTSTSLSIATNSQQTTTNLSNIESSSLSEQDSDINDFEVQDEKSCNLENRSNKRNASAMTETPSSENINHFNPFHKQMQEYMKYTSAEKQLKMESLKEERQVIRAMRETAELNKIIAEQKLKHVLWVKKQEMTMHGGDPGSGAGRGGGAGGSIREAGGSLGELGAAREEEYFYRKQKEQLHNLKSHLDKEISFHEDQIKRHEDAIKRHKQQLDVMDKK